MKSLRTARKIADIVLVWLCRYVAPSHVLLHPPISEGVLFSKEFRMPVLEEKNKVIAVMLMREGNTICASVVMTLADGWEGAKAYAEQIELGMIQAAEWNVPFVMEGSDDGI